MDNVLQKSVTVRCRPEVAFKVFVENIDLWWPSGHRRFEGSTLCLEPFVGGRFFETHSENGEFVLGEVKVSSPPMELNFSWHPGKLKHPTDVWIRFLAVGDDTPIEIEHYEGSAAMGEQWPERAAMFDRGWTSVLANLKDQISNSKRS